jgi:poly-beta-1,6-N-acetyl-D-glucosamine synthase
MHWLLLIVLLPYIYLLLKIYIKLSGVAPYSPEHKPEIFASIVIACRNEEQNLPLLLKDLSEQDYNDDSYEVIIVDDNSSDLTFETASKFKLIKNLVVLHNESKGKKQAIRTGISSSRGKLIITTDADCRMGDRWLKTISSFYESQNPELIICPVKLESRPGFFQKFQELEFLSLQGITAGTALLADPVMCNGANLAFSKEAYKKHSENLHDELPSGDDVFLLLSIKNDPGSQIKWIESGEAMITTRQAESMGSFLRQRARWISKAGAYKDNYTRLLAIVTFVTILLQVFLLVAGIFKPVFFIVFISAFIMKSVPDYLILRDRAFRYEKKSLMRWFIISQAIYPIYILSVLTYFLCRKSEFKS